jgi:hypothetical protein
MKVSQVIEAKNVTNVYYGWSNELQLTVDGGQLNIGLNHSSLRELAKVLNSKITEQDEQARKEEQEKLEEEQEVE